MFKKTQKRIFLDYAAATPVSEKAHQAYCDAIKYFANPQALHTEGLQAARVRDDARSSIAKILGIKSQELLFTSGGTESNNLALAGFLFAVEKKTALTRCHLVVSSIEHPSVGDVLQPFIQRGLNVSYVEPNEHGVVKPESVERLIRDDTILVSIALVNSEIGTIQPIHAIGKMLSEKKPNIQGLDLDKVVFHTDACQGLYQSLVPQGLNVDLMSLDSGKMFGPRGAGALYIRQGIALEPVLRGGSQEKGLRPGTENVALCAGFAAAFQEAHTIRQQESERLSKIKTTLVEKLKEKMPDIIQNGTSKQQSPHILNISFPNIDAEYVAMYLDQRGIALSTKSACLERSDSSQSHVVAALGGEKWRATNTLRLSFGRDTHEKDIQIIVEKFVDAITTYRKF